MSAQNRPLYKDSGLWQVRTDDMEDVIMSQMANESFKDFIIRYLRFIKLENKGLFVDICINLVNLRNDLDQYDSYLFHLCEVK